MSTTNTKRNGRVTPPKPRTLEPVPPEPAVALTPVAPAGRLRLLKVVLQPTFVLVSDDESVQEVAHPVVEVKGVDWPTWASTVFSDDALDALRQTITINPPT